MSFVHYWPRVQHRVTCLENGGHNRNCCANGFPDPPPYFFYFALWQLLTLFSERIHHSFGLSCPTGVLFVLRALDDYWRRNCATFALWWQYTCLLTSCYVNKYAGQAVSFLRTSTVTKAARGLTSGALSQNPPIRLSAPIGSFLVQPDPVIKKSGLEFLEFPQLRRIVAIALWGSSPSPLWGACFPLPELPCVMYCLFTGLVHPSGLVRGNQSLTVLTFFAPVQVK